MTDRPAALDVQSIYEQSPLMRALVVLGALTRFAKQAGIPDDSPGLAEPKAFLEMYEHALKTVPKESMCTPPSSGPWSGEHYEEDNGASLCITTPGDGVIALLPRARFDHVDDSCEFDGSNAPRESFDLANLRHLLACVNACEGIPTHALEAMRPDVEPFVDDRGQHFVIYSEREYAVDDDRAGYWSNEDGWTTLDGATRFTHAETGKINLPLGDGQWTHVTDAHHYDAMRSELADGSAGMKP